jgi:hypothetical protein
LSEESERRSCAAERQERHSRLRNTTRVKPTCRTRFELASQKGEGLHSNLISAFSIQGDAFSNILPRLSKHAARNFQHETAYF